MENNGNTIDDVVKDLGNMPGAIIAIAAMNNGLKLSESVRHDDLGNKAAAMLATALASGKEAMGMLLGQEESIRGVFYTNDALLMIVPAGNKALLALLISNGFHEESMPMVSLKLAADKIAAIIK